MLRSKEEGRREEKAESVRASLRLPSALDPIDSMDAWLGNVEIFPCTGSGRDGRSNGLAVSDTIPWIFVKYKRRSSKDENRPCAQPSPQMVGWLLNLTERHFYLLLLPLSLHFIDAVYKTMHRTRLVLFWRARRRRLRG